MSSATTTAGITGAGQGTDFSRLVSGERGALGNGSFRVFITFGAASLVIGLAERF